SIDPDRLSLDAPAQGKSLWTAPTPPLAFYYAEAMAADSGLRLSSSANPLLKEIRKAARRGRATADGLWLAESPHLLEEAASSGTEIACILLADGAGPAARAAAEGVNAPLRLVSDELFAELATTEHSQGVLA